MIDEEDEEMMHQAISRSLLRAEREKSTKINVTLPIDATTEAIIEEDGVDNSSSSSSTHGLSANNLVDEKDGAVDNVSIDGMEHGIANGNVGDEGRDNSSLDDDDDDDNLNSSTISKPQHEDGAVTASRLKTDDAELSGNDIVQAELTLSNDSNITHLLEADTTIKQPTPLSGTETTPSSSLLSRGMSLFSRGPKQQQQQQQQSNSTRIESDCNSSVVSEMTPDVKSAITVKSNKIVDDDENDDDNILRQNLEEAGLVLLKRLIEFLSECPPASDEVATYSQSPLISKKNTKKQQQRRQRGLTLPASAIGWLSTQIYDDDTTTGYTGDCTRVSKQQLQCIARLFKRVTTLRISGEEWPPPMAIPGSKKTAAVAGGLVNTAKKSITTNLLSKFSTDTSVDDDVVDDDASCGTTTTSTDNTHKQNVTSLFQRYYHELKTNPRVNMSFFTNATKVIINGIPPNWVTELDSLTNLEMFQYEKGCIVDINQLFFPLNMEGLERINHIPESTKPFEYMSLTKLRLSNCAMGETSGLRGRRRRRKRMRSGEETTLPRMPPFSRFPNLVSLNISHNELHKMKTILAGLSSLPLLSSLDLSYNRLSSLDNIYMYLGNVTELLLSGNAITSTRGLDRVFSLERLALDDNKITELTHIVGIAKLPFLMNLDMKGNPFEIDDPTSCRVKVLNLFREVRCSNLPKDATFRDLQRLLPILDKELATKDELVALKNLTYRTTVITMDTITTDNNKDGSADETTRIDDRSEISIHMPYPSDGRRCIVKTSETTLARLGITGLFSIDVKLDGRWLEERCRDEVENELNDTVRTQFNMAELITSIRPKFNIGDYIIGEKEGGTNRGFLRARSSSSNSAGDYDNLNNVDKYSQKNFHFDLPPALLAEADDGAWNPTTLLDRVPSDIVMWDIEDSIVQEQDDIDVLQPNLAPLDDDGQDQKSEEEHDLANRAEESIFDGIWEQAYREIVESTASDDIPFTENTPSPELDFDALEKHSRFDGNSDLGAMFVSSNLDLYFDLFIFPKDTSEDCKLEDDVHSGVGELVAPRIQLFKFDRQTLINNYRMNAVHSSVIDLQERYVGVCKEHVLACGTHARARMSPVQIPKRTFHGDTVTRAGKVVMISESRNFILCLSETALYFITDDNISTSQKSSRSKRPFPTRIPSNATFSDAYWPHALIRHPLDCLRGITIGFQFQRLILRFSVSSTANSSSLEYTYVIITANKLQTVSLLQKIEEHNLGAGAMIDNDDKTFFDALGIPKSNEVVLHYQILRQFWKRGDRETPTRSFVLTDSKVYLIDETYIGDGTYNNSKVETTFDKKQKQNLGDVSLTIIDSAMLSRVTEVRAANEDPRMITLVVLSQNKLKRSHRWRLMCNDGEGAERLIDAVRKAIGAMV